MSRSDAPASGWKKRLPLVIALVVGTVVWKGGFGFFATSRQVTWRLDVPYGEVRKVELQVWREASLLRREERLFPTGASEELKQEVVMRHGPHRALARVWLRDATEPRVFSQEFDPGAHDTLVVAPSP
ncbi:MAG: hypothetical protein IAE78_04520 [Myxococcus sp.]|nr:hypothetical protein [Myxococcus sp.]